MKAFGASYVLVTNGKKGQVLFDGKTAHKAAVKLVAPVDTMGAGDSFFAAFVVSLMRSGWSRGALAQESVIREAFEFAADFSAKTCLSEGSFGFATRYE